MRFANIREMHRPSAVGIAQEAAIDDKGLYLGAKIVDGDAWVKVVEGVYKGFSIGGRVTARDPADHRIITGLTLTEISVVDRPANPEAVFDCWKRSALAKAPGDSGDDAAENGSAGDYGDPGYQADGRPRYPLDSERHVRAAWAFIHQPHNARRYTPVQLAQIKQRIVAAWRARIDRNGPPADAVAPEAARKDLAGDRPAQIILDLDWLDGRIAAEAVALRQRLRPMIGELRHYVTSLVGDEGAAPTADGDAAASPLAAMAIAGALRKASPVDVALLAGGLATLADAILPRLDALQKRVEDIASTPLPPQTLARAINGISKREDGGSETATPDLVAALARMSEEERTLTLIKAAHAVPIAAFSRPPR